MATKWRQSLKLFSEWMDQNKLHVTFSQVTNQPRTSQRFRLTRPSEKLLLETIKKKWNPVGSGKLKAVLSQISVT